jgi:hypothetical protein
VLVAHEPLGLLVHFGKQLLRHIAGQQSAAVHFETPWWIVRVKDG